MPKRKAAARSRTLNQRDVELLREAIRNGFPWLLHTADDPFRSRRTGLTIQQNILLSHVTGITAGAGVFLSGEDHPTEETVAAVKAELQADIAEAERRYGQMFTGTQHKDGFFRFQNPYSPERSEY